MASTATYAKNDQTKLEKRLCLLCLKFGQFFDNHDVFKRIQEFSRFLGRYSDQKIDLRFCVSWDANNLGCCSDCLALTNEFCRVYHQIKCMELQLEWNLERIVQIIRKAGRVPSRVKRFRHVVGDSDVVNMIKALRQTVVTTGNA